MFNIEDILKQQIPGSLDEKHLKIQRQAYINYTSGKLAGLIPNLHDEHGKSHPWTLKKVDKN